MLYAILTLALVVAIYAPQYWVRHTMRKYSKEISQMPGTGGELAQHLVDRLELEGVTVETTDEGRDHFDPSAPAVRLSPSIHDGKSLTALAVATHEVGHAIQFSRNEAVFQLRSRYMPTAMLLRRAGEVILLVVPIVALVLKAPPLIIALVALSLGLQLLGAGAYLIMLPEEWDASFNKALPILEQGEYVPESSLPAIRSVLRAAALTYFASALASIVNLGRWALLLRR
ncbi:MAG: zinc metallopeptidase [Marinobacter sp.]|uniref:zinc metallopeptidase n=1 Tax=Marinobacter sp. TaxID=50741 RepID=UPI003298A264